MLEIEIKEDLIQQIAKELREKVDPLLNESLNIFIRSYFSLMSAEDLVQYDPQALSQMVWASWEFILERPPGTAKIRIYTNVSATSRSAVRTIIEVINDDMPFLVDSTMGSINSLGLFPHLVIHPVLKIARNKQGQLKELLSKTQDKGRFESFIKCEISGPIQQEVLRKLEDEIAFTLHNVRLSVSSWQDMVERLNDIINQLKVTSLPDISDDLGEIISFLTWLGNHHFTFLGYCRYDFIPSKTSIKRKIKASDGLGILENREERDLTRLFEGVEFSPHNRRYLIEPDPLILAKTTQFSVVHRRDPMDSIIIKRYDDKGNIIGLHHFVGLFTSVAYNRSARDIPLLRLKVQHVLERSGFAEDWHDGKALLHILESFPRDELFQASERWLFETSIAILNLQNRQRLTLFVRPDKFERYVSCLVYIPRDLYDNDLRTRIMDILEQSFQGKASTWSTQLGELAFARLYLIIQLTQKGLPSYNKDFIEQQLKDTSLTWRDRLLASLYALYGEGEGQRLFDCYNQGFSKGYQEKFNEEDACFDIEQIEKVIKDKKLSIVIAPSEARNTSHFKVRIYSPQKPIALSDVLPVLEFMDLRILSEIPFKIQLREITHSVWIHELEVNTRDNFKVNIDQIEDPFLETFYQVWEGRTESDGFNRLVMRAGMSTRQCQLFRAYSKYLRQLKITFSQTYMADVLAAHPAIVKAMFELFVCQFDPEFSKNRQTTREAILKKIKTLLTQIESVDEDSILRKFTNIISATLRTNFFQTKNGESKSYLSFKFDCCVIEDLPLPKPLYEIFVYSARFEAVHLRGGKVARGGIRWSDRREDFRTEILGLMKAQMVKNTVIVPTGSKGGFVAKHVSMTTDRSAIMAEVIECYQSMMRGMLDLTDNIIDGQIVSHEDVVRWDEPDPYLVVAADKGTATFSDYANQISQEYNFWLGDAFASGGSAGYDHKKIGITARGAWESVKRHFREMNIDADTAEISVVGIGDMSGDVFGNGMLLSQNLKLIAAFNHMHIFIDPAPNVKKSYQERKRLFEMSRSTWADYDPKLISAGGGVFERTAKIIPISRQIREILDISEDQLTSDELIRYILKAPVDLLWFGGIGTFVKSREEVNSVVGDRANDAIRINGQDLRVKVVAEGANLGMTQKGRIEYARAGGRVNTDAIDNSAGVDCSDHEVNIKILLGQLMRKDILDLKARNKMLENMTQDVATLVLRDNFWQNQAISLAFSQGVHLLDEQARFIRDLEASGLLNRDLESLPDEIEITRRMADKQALTRPELAVLMSYAKLSLIQQLLKSNIPDSGHLNPKLLSYFPNLLVKNYKKEIENHPLKRNIIAMLITNTIVNRMGFTFINEMVRQTGCSVDKVVRAYLIVRDLLGLAKLWREIESLQRITTSLQIELLLEVYHRVKRFTGWFIRFIREDMSLEENINYFKKDYDHLSARISMVLPEKTKIHFKDRSNAYEKGGVPSELALQIAHLSPLVSAPDIITLSHETGKDVDTVARVYFFLGEELGFAWLRSTATSLLGDTHWQQSAMNGIIEDLFISQKRLTEKLIRSGINLNNGKLKEHLHSPEMQYKKIEPILKDLKNASSIDLPMLMVVSRELSLFSSI